MADDTIIIKRVKKGGHAHHGGAWKIAYADFVTAMMAFFLLMWLINMTSPEQKQGLADYFAPASVSFTQSGAGKILGGKDANEEQDISSGTNKPAIAASPPDQPSKFMRPDELNVATADKPHTANMPESKQADFTRKDALREAVMFEHASNMIRQAMQNLPELAELSKNIIIDETPEGLRIQIVDQEGRSMFPPGGVEPYERARLLLRELAKVLNELPNRLTIGGHTDATPLDGDPAYSNWELTSDRANASRRILQKAGVRGDRIYQVAGKADSEPLFPDDPKMAANRRISIVLLREAPVLPPSFGP